MAGLSFTGAISMTGALAASAPAIEVAGPTGQQAYTTAGTYSWTAPTGVTSVCVVCVGGGGAGPTYLTDNNKQKSGHGAGLGWKNNITVVPGQTYTVVVGAAGDAASGAAGGDSYFINTATVKGGKGLGFNTHVTVGAGTFVGDGGGTGGWGAGSYGATQLNGGGGGAGGYSGAGGNGGFQSGQTDFAAVRTVSVNGFAGSGGGGGGGGFGYSYAYSSGTQVEPGYGPGSQLGANTAGPGGGVGIFGQGSNGTGGIGNYSTSVGEAGSGGSGRTYGGGGAAMIDNGRGGGGAVRIIWGTGRAFPSTLTADQ